MHKLNLSNEAVKAAVDAVRASLLGSASDAIRVLAPLWRSAAESIERQVFDPFYAIDWHGQPKETLLKAWRQGIAEWRSAAFEGMTPGQLALQSTLESVGEDFTYVHMGQAWIAGVPAADWIAEIVSDISPHSVDDVVVAVTDWIAQEVRAIQLAAAMKRGIPPGIFAELVWIPGWPGQSIDGLWDLRVSTSGPHHVPEALVPSVGLRNFLQWVNVSTEELIQTLQYRDDVAGLRLRQSLGTFAVTEDLSRPRLVTAENLITMIENSTENSVPVVHCEVDIKALLDLDPRHPMAWPTRRGEMHIGLHDFFNGAGYMDTYPGTAVINAMTGGFVWEGRTQYGIDHVYGLVKHLFRAVPVPATSLQQELEAA